jgi:allophanate hydrolase subunit 1
MSSRILKIEERRIIATKKPSGYIQYFLTIPKDYAEKLKAQGIASLYIAYNNVLIAFPANSVSERDLLIFLQAHSELEKLLRKQTEEIKPNERRRFR